MTFPYLLMPAVFNAKEEYECKVRKRQRSLRINVPRTHRKPNQLPSALATDVVEKLVLLAKRSGIICQIPLFSTGAACFKLYRGQTDPFVTEGVYLKFTKRERGGRMVGRRGRLLWQVCCKYSL